MMIISYCSQIKNRFHQFSQTFSHNLDKIQRHQNTEWVIVDCGSDDGVQEFMREFTASGVEPRIHYYSTVNYDSYSIPIAKNFSARLSSGDYIFNLDVDNFISDATETIMEKGEDVGIYCNVFKLGVYGRLGCSRRIFGKVGGYNESFFPAGKHETDLRLRCSDLLGCRFEDVPCKVPAILNSKEDTIKHTKSSMSWKTMNFINECKMKMSLAEKDYHPNRKFTGCEFIKDFGEKTFLEEYKFYADAE
jgi:glycosyltransferase involved in cell wall biosynthesis